MLEIGSVVDGKYKILHMIGKGGMSTVYLAVNERANKHWAVKEVRKEGVRDYEVVRQNLIMETSILRNLRHPHLPSIVDIIDTEDFFLIVMDYIEGRTMEDMIRESGAQSQNDVILWAKQLCSVLTYLHTREPPVIYRDMKPSNIMVKPDGDVMLVDFGTARELKASGSGDTICLGTRGYAAPEQYGGCGQTDSRTDIYCLGATLYHMVTGQDPSCPPYEIYPIRYWNPAFSPGLERIIQKCTRPDPEERYQNCEELLYAFENYEKQDDTYRKRQIAHMKIFMITSLMTLIFGLASLFCGLYGRTLTSLSYEGFLDQIKQAQSVSDMKHAALSAVALDPGNPEAYNQMLLWITADHELTDEEKTALESVLYEKQYGVQNIRCLKRHKKDFAWFSYQMGITYFFYYRGIRGKNIAKSWFDDLDKASLDAGQKARASIYARIGSYYTGLGKVDKSGEKEAADYGIFFKDLCVLNNYSPKQLGTSQAALTLYCEIAGQIGKNAVCFLTQGGVTGEQLNREMNKIASRVSQLNQSDTAEIKQLQNNLKDARMKISSAIEQQERNLVDKLP